MKSSATRYGSIAQFLHWCTAIVVLVTFMYGPGGSEQRVYSSVHEFDRRLHETLGLCVFALTLVRLLWRAYDARLETPPVSRWMAVMATTVRWMLYLLLLALPLTAISGAWLEGHPLTLIGGYDIPPLLSSSHEAGSALATLHAWLGDAIMWLAGLHAFAAIFHHAFLKDDVLIAMLPRWFPAGRARTDGRSSSS
ncbi:cytochrome b/b6 domain-containing protein [Paraburkholderia sp. MM5384-R2]|uniref:cytochrome b n=1 Tax=Paraburkholderia sp. MM5384-R2 TaxID=2723097 RepID=UPI00185C3A54|nr:cytochrome b/b6 domain-containing protein [Paraburkholderia sp. MM5384-R2]MBB5501202.1 cytochrome b561 [Paraburkholderia sp. MM5384-R2]